MSAPQKRTKKALPQNTCAVLFDRATEPPFSGKYLHNKESGEYTCANCGNLLFSSGTKYDSGSGWPSFFSAAAMKSVAYHEDTSAGMLRTEVVCAKCGGHLGHVFDDGPMPTGKRFCINSAALGFTAKKAARRTASAH